MPKLFKFRSRSAEVTQGQMTYPCCTDLKVGGWSHFQVPTILKVSSRSPGAIKVIRVTQGQICIVCRMEVKLGGWGYRPMPKMLEVSSRSSGVTQGQICIV